MKPLLTASIVILIMNCNNQAATDSGPDSATDTSVTKLNYSFERFDPAFDNIVSSDATAEIIAEGFDWSEGSLWIERYNMLLFSDVPTNTIYKWTKEKGKELYITPSGYTGSEPSNRREPGSNGLTLDLDGNLVLCQHGDRRVSRMDAPLDNPEPKFIPLAEQYNGKKFSSPNDCVFNSKGELFFTDPPYGLPRQNDSDPLKEQPFNGVYKVKTDGTVILLADSISRPNGIAFFPGETRLLVSSSDPRKPNWYVWDINGDALTHGKIFHSVAGYDRSLKGLPDGLRIDSKGNVYASGPGGLYFFNSEGKKLGMLHLENATSNCSLSPDEKTLYITNDMYILRVKLRN